MNVRELLQPKTENTKQLEFYKTIEDVGLRIYLLKDTPENALKDFYKFCKYFENQKKCDEFLTALHELEIRYKIEGVDPDKLLFTLHNFDQYIIYDDYEDIEEYNFL